MQQHELRYKPLLRMALCLQTVEHCRQEGQSLCTSIHKNRRRPFKWFVQCRATHVVWQNLKYNKKTFRNRFANCTKYWKHHTCFRPIIRNDYCKYASA